MKFRDYLNNITGGESVLIEHASLSAYPLLFYGIGNFYGWERILLVDIEDSSLPVIRWLRLSGLDVPRNLRRIKTGGTSKWGNVILDVNPHEDPRVFLSKFNRKINQVYTQNDFTVTMIMNPERLVPLQNGNRKFILTLSNLAATFLGNPRRITFYFVNREMSERTYLALLEEMFTRVLSMDSKGVRILKSPKIIEEGTLLEV